MKTDLEREASEIVRDLIARCAEAEGFQDPGMPSAWHDDGLRAQPFVDRIVELALQAAAEALADETLIEPLRERARAWCTADERGERARRTTELL
jgi:hypothetical protein